MGVIVDTYNESRNILTDYGFRFEGINKNHSLSKCYERKIRLNCKYYAYVSVKPRTRQVVVIVECQYRGGYDAANIEYELESEWSDSQSDVQKAFFEELDSFVTKATQVYREDTR